MGRSRVDLVSGRFALIVDEASHELPLCHDGLKLSGRRGDLFRLSTDAEIPIGS